MDGVDVCGTGHHAKDGSGLVRRGISVEVDTHRDDALFRKDDCNIACVGRVLGDLLPGCRRYERRAVRDGLDADLGWQRRILIGSELLLEVLSVPSG